MAKRDRAGDVKAEGALKYAHAVARALGISPDDVPKMDVIQFQFDSLNKDFGKGAGEHYAECEDALVDRSQYEAGVFYNARANLSNFCRVEIEVDGKKYPSVEHAFHAGKALFMDKPDVARKFACGGEYASLAGKEVKLKGGKRGAIGDMRAKKIGESLTAQEVWDAYESERVMAAAVRARAAVDKTFTAALASTGKALLVHQTRGAQDVRLSVILHALRDELCALK